MTNKHYRNIKTAKLLVIFPIFLIFYHSFVYSKCWRFFSFDPECAYLFLPFQNIIYILSTFILRCCWNSIIESHKGKWTETSKLIIYLFCEIIHKKTLNVNLQLCYNHMFVQINTFTSLFILLNPWDCPSLVLVKLEFTLNIWFTFWVK